MIRSRSGARVNEKLLARRPAPTVDLKPEEIRQTAKQLRDAESGVRVLRSLAWEPHVRTEFFARKARELPRVEYPSFDASPVHAALRDATRGVDGASPTAGWFLRSAEAIGVSADLIASAGTPRFLKCGVRLFGLPTTDLSGATPLGLAQRIDGLCGDLAGLDLGEPPPACHLAEDVARQLREASSTLFGDESPQVLVVDELSANALAGPRRIQVRRDACFTDRDAGQLVQHEAYVHVCTSLNGRHQVDLPLLGASHAGTTRTQEGLAVFAEFITGVVDLDRFRRLADRVLAIQMAIEGADFLDVYGYFLERRLSEEQAFENARRVFRGGVLTGGAPFLKDSVYLSGLLRVTNFLRAMIAANRADCLPLLFCGKLDLEDLPALAHLNTLGLCQPPRFLPPWAADRRFLVTYLAYSAFLNTVRLDEQRAHFQALLAGTPHILPNVLAEARGAAAR